MVVATLADELEITGATHTPFQRLVTIEGEYGTFATISGIRDAKRVEIAIAILFGDDWYSTIEGATTPALIPQLRDEVLELAVSYSLGLGAIRRRRYQYAPPAGWIVRTRGLIDEWQQPGTTSAILVFPSRPLVETAAGAVDRALHELVIDGFVATTDQHVPLRTARFANGIARFVTGTREGATIHHDVAVLQDERFSYVARLESTPELLVANRDVFAKLVESIEPLPKPQRETVDPALTASWVD